MGTAKLSFWKDVVPVVKSMSKKTFVGHRDRNEKTADAISEAWVLFESAPPEATAMSLAYYAVKRVKVGRHFPERQRSITGPNLRRLEMPNREPQGSIALEILAGYFADPADVAAMRVDFPPWFGTLTRRQQRICLEAVMGETTKEMALKLGITPGAISQIRRRLVELWEAYTA